jgi:Cdc6-like AAA superfamily ATPase
VVVNDELLSICMRRTAYALLSASERIQWIRQDRWIHDSRADQVLNRLFDLLTYPARDRMPCLLLFGPTGMGKTRIVQKFLREHRSSFDDVTGRTVERSASSKLFLLRQVDPRPGACKKATGDHLARPVIATL